MVFHSLEQHQLREGKTKAMSDKEFSVSRIKESTITNVIKRDGTMVPFDSNRIYNAILRAGESTGEFGEQESCLLTGQVLKVLEHKYTETFPEIEGIQDVVGQVLITANYFATANSTFRAQINYMICNLYKI